MSNETVVIQKRFCGPPHSGNGGYVCGLLAERLNGPVEFRLRKPVPLEIELKLRVQAGQVELLHDEDEIASATSVPPAPAEIPAAPGFSAARACAERYAGFATHAFPGCFVCGPGRETGDGLRIFAGPTDDASLVAAPWIPGEDLCDSTGNVRTRFLWAALDCPGAFAAMLRGVRTLVLVRLRGAIDRTLPAGERCVIIGWSIADRGRRQEVGTAIFNEAGQPIASALGLWMELSAP